MTAEEIATRYDELSKEEQIYFLALLAHELTLYIRGCYSETPQIVNSNPGSPVGNLNEIQHRVAGNLMDVILEEPDRADGQGLVEWLMDWARNGRVEQQLVEALSSALSRVGSP